MSALHEALKVVVEPLQNCELNRFVVKTGEVVDWNRVPLLISYCPDIPETKDFSAVRLGFVVKRPCARCMMTEEEVINDVRARERSIKDRKMISSRHLEPLGNDIGSIEDRQGVAQEE